MCLQFSDLLLSFTVTVEVPKIVEMENRIEIEVIKSVDKEVPRELVDAPFLSHFFAFCRVALGST